VLAKALVAPAPVVATGFAIVRAGFLLAVRRHRVIDALFVFALVILPMVAFIALTPAVLGALDGTGMLILPP